MNGEARSVAHRSTHGGRTGTGWLVLGSIVGGLAAYGFQVVGTRALGSAGYAPIGTLWTIQYLAWSVVLFTVETFVVRETLRAPGRRALSRATAIGAWRWIVGAAAIVTVSCWLVRDRLFYGVEELAIIVGAIVLSFGALAIIRGQLAGEGRYLAYGVISAGESVARLAIATGIAMSGASTRALAWTLPAGAAVAVSSWFALALVRGRRDGRVSSGDPPSPDATGGGRFLVPMTVVNAAAQLLLAGAPVAMVVLSASASEVSVFFVTLTAARVPIVVALGGLLSRVLPAFVDILARRGRTAMPRMAVLVAAAAIGVAAVGAISASAVGGPLIGAFFGQEFSPPGWLAAAVAAGVVLATGGLVLNQLLIADGSEQRLIVPWTSGLMSAIATMLIVTGTPSRRVGFAFVVGEMVALGALVAVARFASRRDPTPP
jgi:O-antigen/teichoic acid export membrane protein